MITCPKCGELNGENREECFKCSAKLRDLPASSATDIIVTKSDIIDGYRVSKYLGTVSGTEIYLVGGVFGGGLANQENLFGTAYEKAESLMVSKAKAKGSNAIISVQTNLVSPGNLNNIIVIVQGTAVYIEKNE